MEWLYTVLGLVGCYLVVKKKRIGWLIWLLSCPIMVGVLIHKQSYPIILVFIAYGILNIKGWIEWK